jgi:hypothetical protein
MAHLDFELAGKDGELLRPGRLVVQGSEVVLEVVGQEPRVVLRYADLAPKERPKRKRRRS